MRALFLTAAQITIAIFGPWYLGKWIRILFFDDSKIPFGFIWIFGALTIVILGLLCVMLYELYKLNRTIIKDYDEKA
uniref:Uncharacterized protein n=1 Tax=viral metagenome TaxID=1070528 RepID=A0A6M3L8P6_9ZZZZ